jgi:Protein of unknown function (DUF664)
MSDTHLEPVLSSPLPRTGNEREMLVSFLDYFRSILLRKVHGLTTQQAQQRLEPSDLHLHGLIRHMAFVEQYWFTNLFAGVDETFYWDDPTDPDRDFHPLSGDELGPDLQLLLNEHERSRHVERHASALDQVAVKQREGEPVDLRWIMIHMIEEYGRHCGHADFLREAIDGVTGD